MLKVNINIIEFYHTLYKSNITTFHYKDFSINDSEVTDKKSFETPEQLTEQMITLSSLPKSKWQNLLNLDTIKVSSFLLFITLCYSSSLIQLDV